MLLNAILLQHYSRGEYSDSLIVCQCYLELEIGFLFDATNRFACRFFEVLTLLPKLGVLDLPYRNPYKQSLYNFLSSYPDRQSGANLFQDQELWLVLADTNTEEVKKSKTKDKDSDDKDNKEQNNTDDNSNNDSSAQSSSSNTQNNNNSDQNQNVVINDNNQDNGDSSDNGNSNDNNSDSDNSDDSNSSTGGNVTYDYDTSN